MSNIEQTYFNAMHNQPYNNNNNNNNNKIKGLPFIKPEKINTLTNKIYLMKLERQYDEFLEKNHHILLLLDCLEQYLDIRDAITVRLGKLIREDEIKSYYLSYENYIKKPTPNNPFYHEYNHTYQSLLSQNIRLSQEQIEQGYVPCPHEPREYKCGCLSMSYYVETETETETQTEELELEDILPIIKKHHYCDTHSRLINKKKTLEHELESVKKELSNIRSPKNSLDFQYYMHTYAYTYKYNDHANKRYISKYPWKNVHG
jgi:hypothetical protein